MSPEASPRFELEQGRKARAPKERALQTWRLIGCVFLPFAAGYYLSYLFRTITSAISPPLMSEFALDAADIGLLASVYFLFFAAAQLPLGVLLDRFGPRRTQGVLLVIAAGGATLFGTASGFAELLVARAMIGLGVAGALMAGLKAIVLWFPKERVALVNGYMIMLGSLGAVTATAPAEWLLDGVGWRGLFEILTFATVVIAALIYFIAPEHAPSSRRPPRVTLKAVYTDPHFWRIAPLSATCIGSSWALQSLWAAPWLLDVERLDRHSVVTLLFILALGISAAALLLGTVADQLRRRGFAPEDLLAAVAGLFVAAQLTLILRVPLPPLLPWSVVPVVGAATVLSFATIAEHFPNELTARANGALNLLHFGWAFAVQYGIGLVIEQWLPQNGHYPAEAYRTAFGASVAFQLLALIWFAMPRFRALSRQCYAFLARRYPYEDGRSGLIATPEGALFEECEGSEW
jgi:MFS family permease